MGCILSSSRGDGGTTSVDSAEIYVFAPGMRVPKNADFANTLHGLVPAAVVERLVALQNRVVAMVREESTAPKSRSKRRTATQNGETTVEDLQQALDDYLPLLLGLVREGRRLTDSPKFVWSNQEDEEQETSLSSAHYELLSVLQLMAVLDIASANRLLSPFYPGGNPQDKGVEDNRRAAVDVLMKVSGKLDCAVNTVMPKISEELKGKLPADLSECILRALSLQALGQGVEIQLGLAIDNLKATLAVKRRLACEHVKYWQQAFDSIQNATVGGAYGRKHSLYVNWKCMESQAAAYYYHGMIVDEGSEANAHAKAIVCLQTADSCLKGSQSLRADFCSESPPTRVPPVWGAMKYLSERIPKELSIKTRIYKDMYRHEKFTGKVTDLPDFPLSLQAEEFSLPGVDPMWELHS